MYVLINFIKTKENLKNMSRKTCELHMPTFKLRRPTGRPSVHLL